MKCMMKQMDLGLLLLLVIPVCTIGCERTGAATDLTATAQIETIDAGIVSTMSALTAQTAAAELVVTHVAGTIAAMATSTQPVSGEGLTTEAEITETPVSAEALQTSIAATVVAGLTLTAPPPTISVIQIQVKETVNVSAVNVRQGPDTCFAVVGTLAKGRVATVLGRNATRFWYQIELTNGIVGWIWADYVELTNPNLSDQVSVVRDIRACPLPSVAATVVPSPPTVQPPEVALTPIPTIAPTPTVALTPTNGNPYPYP
jgi:uncharacterized protein YraI